MDFTIRQGTENDIQAAFSLICELAAFEKAADEVINSPEQMLHEGFGENPAYGFYVAELGDKKKGHNGLIALALYYYRYSTWKGKCLYLEDLIVQEPFRGYGIGKALLSTLVDQARKESLPLVQWQVLDWNQKAIDFYKSMGAEIDTEWYNVRIYS